MPSLDPALESGLELPVVPLPLFVLLRLVAYSDRKLAKDLEAVEHVLRNYGHNDERFWGLEHAGELVEYDYGPAYLLGADGKQFMGPELVATLTPLLGSLFGTAEALDSESLPTRLRS